MKYVIGKVKLSEMQAKKLMSGMGVRLNHSALEGGDQEVGLTATQAKRMAKAIQSGRGVALNFSPAQCAYHRKSGSGLFSRIGRFFKRGAKALFKKVIKPVAKTVLSIPVIKDLAKQGISQASNLAGTALGGVLGNSTVGKAIASQGENLANKGLDALGKGRRGGSFRGRGIPSGNPALYPRARYSPRVGTPAYIGSGDGNNPVRAGALMPSRIVRKVIKRRVMKKAPVVGVPTMRAINNNRLRAPKAVGDVPRVKRASKSNSLFMGTGRGVMALSSLKKGGSFCGRGISKVQQGRPQQYAQAVNTRAKFLL